MGRPTPTPWAAELCKAALMGVAVAVAATVAAAAAAASPTSGGCCCGHVHAGDGHAQRVGWDTPDLGAVTHDGSPLTGEEGGPPKPPTPPTWTPEGNVPLTGDGECASARGGGELDLEEASGAAEDTPTGEVSTAISGGIIIPGAAERDVSPMGNKPNIAAWIVYLTNEERKRILDLDTVRTWSILTCNAVRHSAAMEKADKLSFLDGLSLSRTLCNRYISQNVLRMKASGKDKDVATAAMRVWIKNPKTRDALLKDGITHVGCGVSSLKERVYATCIFTRY